MYFVKDGARFVFDSGGFAKKVLCILDCLLFRASNETSFLLTGVGFMKKCRCWMLTYA